MTFSPHDQGPARILVVDDSPTNRYVLATVLRRAGHHVTEAEDGTSALALLAAPGPPPEVALVDVRLPDMTGFEVCERIKGDPATTALPVINISASAITTDDRTQGLTRGADAYLVDPVAPAELLATVTATLRYARARRRAENLADRLRLLHTCTLRLYHARDAEELARAAAEGAGALLHCRAAASLTAPQGSHLLAHTWEDPAEKGQGPGHRVHPVPPNERLPLLACWPGVDEDPVPLRAVTGHAKPERPPVTLLVPADAVTGEDEHGLLAQLAQASALALEALRSYSEEHALALTLQRSFLPAALPVTSRAELAVRYLPANERTEIGGDFYEAIDTPGGLVVAVGDVAGHSLDAAMVMGEVRHALRAYAAEGHRPEDILTRLDHLLACTNPQATVTLCVLLIEHATDLVHVANAGHLPPLVRSPEGASYCLREHGPLLGLGLPHPPALRVTVPAGSLLLLVTDGLVERRGEDLEQGIRRLTEAWESAPGRPEEACAHVLERLAPQGEDDVALLAVRLQKR
ncbi:fused response regulator/phosphatase [Streptomyces sp. Tu6071]|uniref:fused response regulator/phosphatase n=1 Tax=Streptomyces sp. Tu6071 TaxID=355249 RepID=UPI0002F86F07|nr:fused response regulator/phosphatase [Streptomyces sp. Tu6071]